MDLKLSDFAKISTRSSHDEVVVSGGANAASLRTKAGFARWIVNQLGIFGARSEHIAAHQALAQAIAQEAQKLPVGLEHATNRSVESYQQRLHAELSLSYRRIEQHMNTGAKLSVADVQKELAFFSQAQARAAAGAGLGQLKQPGESAGAHERFAALIGRTLPPLIASNYLDRLELDHTGMVLGLKADAEPLGLEEIASLERSVLDKGLRETNAKGPRDVARTDREILLDMICTLQAAKLDKPDAPQSYNEKLDDFVARCKSMWLSMPGTSQQKQDALRTSIGAGNVTELLDSIASWATSPAIRTAARELGSESEKLRHRTQHYDNTFGRAFESALVSKLIAHPPASVVSASAAIGHHLYDQIAGLDPALRQICLSNLASYLSHDPRPWHAETPDVDRFLASPTMANLEELLKPTSPSGYDVIKLHWVAVKASISFPPQRPAPWMQEANANYASVIVPSRSQKPSLTGAGVKLESAPVADLIAKVDTVYGNRMRQAGGDLDKQRTIQLQHRWVRDRIDHESFSATRVGVLWMHIDQLAMDIGSNDPEISALLNAKAAELSSASWRDDSMNPDALLRRAERGVDSIDEARMGGVGFEAQQTRTYGTSLAHQPQPEVPAQWGQGSAVQGKTTLNDAKPGTFDRNALDTDMNSVNGPSGSTNIMTFLIKHIQSQRPDFPASDAFAGTMMFLTFDGGHSLPESVGTFRSILTDPRALSDASLSPDQRKEIIDNRKRELENNLIDYGKIHEIFHSPETSLAVKSAADDALTHVTSLFHRVWNESGRADERFAAERTSSQEVAGV